ncbi:MAG TPA: DUF550 domain-containing protein [Chitinophagales bacterium]|nr:DUF550 domain-containing protein [Chitinophagales bacterium]
MNVLQFNKIMEWQDATFPTVTLPGMFQHLCEELKEMVDALSKKETQASLEFADCLLLLFGMAHKAGYSYEEIINAINTKHAINLGRKWGENNRHIPEEEEEVVVKNLVIALSLIGDKLGGNGFIICPQCGNKLYWTRASSNKHVWGKCNTEGCLNWMQ